MPARTYDLSEVLVMIGSVPITEFADGDAVTLEIEGEDWVVEKGSHRAMIRSRANNPLGTLTINTLYGSPVNKLLTELRKADLLSGVGCGSVMIKDLNGETLGTASACWVKKMPPLKAQAQASTVEWVFDVADPVIEHGQNRLL